MEGKSSIFKVAAVCWLLFVFFVAFLAVKKEPTFDSSIMALLPNSDQQVLVQHATKRVEEDFSKKLIMVLSGSNEKKVRAAITSLAQSMLPPNSSASSDFSKVTWKIENTEINKFRDELIPYRFSILDKELRGLLLSGNYHEIIDKALARLYSPLPVGENSIIEDPFGLFTELSLNRYGSLNIQVSDSLLKVTGTDEPTYMLMATLSSEIYSPTVQERVISLLTEQKKLFALDKITLSMSGMLLHAAAGAQQAKNEIFTIGVGSILGIVLLILLVFRQIKPLVLMLLAVMIGCLTAAAMTILIFERVHLVTLAFGAGLVGVSIDYALHFLCVRCVSSSRHILQKILPGLLLALFSSSIAYAAQALTPFPGLRQMAVFSVVGLVSSWITVVLCFPLLIKSDFQQTLRFADKLNTVRKSFPTLKGNLFLSMLLLVFIGLALKILWGSNNLDDIRLLQTSPANLIAQEESVRSALGINSSSQFLLISANTLEKCLQKEEQIIPDLEKIKNISSLNGYQALSSVLPSIKRQKENIVLTEQLYQQPLATYYEMLKLNKESLSLAQKKFEDEQKILTPKVWQKQHESDSWKSLIVVQTDTIAATIIRLNGNLDDHVKQELMTFSEAREGVVYVDRIKSISQLLGNYRSQIIYWVLIAYFVVFLVLLIRYKYQVWRIMLPPFLASLFTLAILVLLEGGVNLFHFLALVLVLGIGMDMGIFLFETEDSPHTWLAVTLSTITSLLAFGLLALSDTPVLHHFGLTVLIGLIIVWLLVPLVRKSEFEESQS